MVYDHIDKSPMKSVINIYMEQEWMMNLNLQLL